MIFKNLLYIYQLEHYDKKRFLSFAYKNINWLTLSKRSELDWTIRAGLIFAVSTACIISATMIVYFLHGFQWSLFSMLLSIVFLPILIVFSDTIIAPLVLLQKNNRILQAKMILQSVKRKGLITVGITGSFGKTTAKQVAVQVLGKKYTIFTFPGNVNTDIGIANYIIKHKSELMEADILIAEMGAYKRGDIKKLCLIINPDYSLTTAIGECHLERFGCFDNIVEAKFELANATKKKIFINTDNENIQKNANAHITGTAAVVRVSGNEKVKRVVHLSNFKGISFTYENTRFTTKIIAEYIIELSVMVFTLAEELGLTAEQMVEGFKKVDFIPHRLEVVRNEEVDRIVIDDSYNGNYDGFLAGLEVLGRAKGRKVVLTPGIVELGAERSEKIHSTLAKKYTETIDLLLLIKNTNTMHILRELRKVGYTAFKMYDSTQEAHDDLSNILENGDTILFQNDITDNYA